MLKVRKAVIDDASPMAGILQEIGWSERRNSMTQNDVAKPIRTLIEHAVNDPKGHTIYVVVDELDDVVGFTNVHWVPFIMLGSVEGYLTDVFVKPSASGKGAGKLLINTIIEEGKNRDAFRLMLTNGKEKPSYKRGFYKKLGWTERPNVANFVYYFKEPWS